MGLMARMHGVRERLLILQAYAGDQLTQEQFANLIGVKKQNWNNTLNVESRGLSWDSALKIHAKFPEITIEWLVLGELHHLTLATIRRLDEAARNIGIKAPHAPSSSARR